ncbi:cytochrome c peroxidase [Aliiruegeria haliotis]|uniref:Cytochrome c peroxidase n=1 Tax=Aliiruegeria haliotis TaxID=1280846 RepID=A0A2T0RLZ5_9RHOB|nr:cytochrome c peroxidase [Aliiruegeria haliotis]PRY22216.1 cytochrome c peroxidase [Aliiruegeria haliotis]
MLLRCAIPAAAGAVLVALAVSARADDPRASGPGFADLSLGSPAGVALPPPLQDSDFLHDAAPDPALVFLGQSLFFDPILSGNRNISCGTCHHPADGTGDGLALGIGEGGTGAGHARRTADAVTGRVPRNAQPLYNIGARAYVSLFHDGRVEVDDSKPGGFRSPAHDRLPQGLDNVLSAQAFFPVVSSVEMAGQKGENLVADAVADHDWPTAWELIARRLTGIPDYVDAFSAAFADIREGNPITYAHAATALAAFQTQAFKSDSSPFDAGLATGDLSALPETAQRGASLFYGVAGCSACHVGPLLTDHRFHAIAMPQIGPGKGHGNDLTYWKVANFRARLEDEGRYNVTGNEADLFAFRTPSLRNVALTGPWGHAGSFDTLEGVVRHHMDSVRSLNVYRLGPERLPTLDDLIEARGRNWTLHFKPLAPERREGFDRRDAYVQSNRHLRERIAKANILAPVVLTESEIDDLLGFLNSLTDPTAVDRSHLIPTTVLSGLPVHPARSEDRAPTPSMHKERTN